MILNENSESGWGWKQDSLVRIDRDTGDVFYNKDFAPVALFSRFIRPGTSCCRLKWRAKDQRCGSERKWTDCFLQNQSTASSSQQIDEAGQSVAVELPATIVCAFVFQ